LTTQGKETTQYHGIMGNSLRISDDEKKKNLTSIGDDKNTKKEKKNDSLSCLLGKDKEGRTCYFQKSFFIKKGGMIEVPKKEKRCVFDLRKKRDRVRRSAKKRVKRRGDMNNLLSRVGGGRLSL